MMINMKKSKIFAFAAALLASIHAFPQTSIKSEEAKAVIESRLNGTYKKTDQTPVIYNEDFEKGKELFALNEPAKAIPYFEKSLESENVDPAVYIYLGVAYYQTKDYNKSLAICVQGLAKDNTDHKVLAYNAGNSCYAMGNYMRADASYAIAIREDQTYAPPVLNRANAQLKLDRLEDARNNYIKYLELDPETPQRAKIEELIRLLQQEIELRAKQKPEIINPDEFVENEKMEVADEPEKVDEVLPVYVAEKDDEMEKVEFDSAAPALPVVRNEQNNGEKISDNLVALANENQNQKVDDENAAEKVDANVPSLPVAKNDDENQKYEEKIQDNLVAVLKENQNEKVNEKPEETLVHIDNLEPVKNENEKVDAEKINPATLATDDYQKNEEAKEKAQKEAELARQKAEEEAEFARSKANEEEEELERLKAEQEAQEKAEKEAELERQKQAEEAAKQAEIEREKQEEAARQAELERQRQEEEAKQAEIERQKQLAEQKAREEEARKKAEAERKAAEEAAKKAQEVPKDVKVKENDDGTVDIKIPTLSFKINSAELTENKSNTETVQKVYDILSDKKYSDLNVTITGYVNPDNDEWTEDENKLALARAESVKKRLVKMGIAASRVKARHGNGKTANKEYNRRVEFLLSK